MLEIRSGQPPEIPLHDVIIEQNRNHLFSDGDEDRDAEAVQICDFVSCARWTREQATEMGIEDKFSEGYFAWSISNVRPLCDRIKAVAKRQIDQLPFDSAKV
jgi:hypothetical protein